MVGDLDSFGVDLLVRFCAWEAIMIVIRRVYYMEQGDNMGWKI